MIRQGDYIEVLKVLRRRCLNALKFIRREFFAVFGIYYDHPSVKKRRHQKKLKRILAKVYDAGSGALQTAIIARDGDTYPKSSAFIRLISPLTQPPLSNKISFKLYPENTAIVEAGTGLCIVQRNAYSDPVLARSLSKNLRSSNIPLVLDTDDAFSYIDPTHPEHNIHTPTIDAFNDLAKKADQVWASTPRLKQIIGGRKTFVIPNTLDDRVWKSTVNNSKRSGRVMMVYMGTVSHDADLGMILAALQKVDAQYPDSFKLTVIGVSSELPDEPWINRVYQKNSIYPKFVEWFVRQGPFDVGLSPLVDNEFNRAKSDIKCLDYLAAGILPVVSDIEPYQTAGLSESIIKVENDSAGWEKALANIVRDPNGFRAKSAPMVAAGQKYIWQKRSSHQAAQQIYKQLQLLFPEL